MNARVFLLDNHDSFTFNLAQCLQALGADVVVRLNDRVSVDWIVGHDFDAIVISPGPGRPERAGITPTLVAAVAGRVPLLGVCLGHQAIAQHHGARIVSVEPLVHGKASRVGHDGRGLYRGMPAAFAAGRYHSLAVEAATLAPPLEACAWTGDGIVMALRHTRLPIDGMQFHPESVLTPLGPRLLAGFLYRAGVWQRSARAA